MRQPAFTPIRLRPLREQNALASDMVMAADGYVEFAIVERIAICMVEGGLSEQDATSLANREAIHRNNQLIHGLHRMDVAKVQPAPNAQPKGKVGT